MKPRCQRCSILSFFSVLLFASLVALGGCSRDDAGTPPLTGADHEIWTLDQGTHTLWIHHPGSDRVERIDLGEQGVRTPHMIDFTSDYRYAFIANLGSGDVTVMRAEDRQIITSIETGAHTHMAGVDPTDSRVLVDVIGSHDHHRDGEVVEILLDLENETFEIGRRLRLADDPLLQTRLEDFGDLSPICHEYSPDGGKAYITLGPSLANGGLVILDVDSFTLSKVWSPTELPVNCGTMPTRDGRYMFVNGGGPESGEWFVIDMASDDVVHSDDSRGKDAHGVWATPDGKEMWMVNRVTDNAIIIDTQTFEIIDEMAFVGETPDIMAMSPDGQFAYVTLRGPNPVSAPHVATGTTPGFAVIDVAARELLEIVEFDKDNEKSDPHGIGVRVIDRQ